MKRKILGISAFYHDSAAAITIGDKIIAAAQEERFTRIKNTSKFPKESIKYCLEEAELELSDLDAIIYYEKPFLTFERLLQSYYAYSPKGIFSFLKAIPVWLNEKLFIKKIIYKGLQEIGEYDPKVVPLLFSEHHLSHAASAFFPSPFKQAAILTIDGVGEWATASISIGRENSIEIVKEMKFPHSVGLLYSSFTFFLGFKVNSGEYKVMGLAPFGNPNSDDTKYYITTIKKHLINLKPDGSIWLTPKYFSFATHLKMIPVKKWEELFKLKKRTPEAEITQQHCDFALAIQLVTEEIILAMAKEVKRLTNLEYLCMAGGVALNCVAMGKLKSENIFKDIYIQPAAGDAGGAIGAALIGNYSYYLNSREICAPLDRMSGTYLGPAFTQKDLFKMNTKTGAIFEVYSDFDELCQFIATKIKEDKIIGWFQGRMEFGPRALGNRSILANPSSVEVQNRLNMDVKKRENFRPFAPAVLAETAHLYFEEIDASPYMQFVTHVHESQKLSLPTNYLSLPVFERLNIPRSKIQSVTHVDFSARVQTVHKETNLKFWTLLKHIETETGIGMVLNTSFNERGEPIVCTPIDAFRCFLNTEIDYLVMGNLVYEKERNKALITKKSFSSSYNLD